MTLDLFSSATRKEWKEWIGFPDPELYPESFEKKSLRKIKYPRSSPDPENYRCGHQQPCTYFFLIFFDFRTLPKNLGKLKSVDSKQKN